MTCIPKDPKLRSIDQPEDGFVEYPVYVILVAVV